MFIICFYLTFVCPTDFCTGWLLPLCSSVQLWSSSAKHEGGIIGAFFAESVGGERLIVEVERLFSWLLLKRGTCFWVLCWYTGSPVVSLGLNLTWNWNYKPYPTLSPESHAFKTSCHVSNKNKEKTVWILFFTSFHSNFSPSLPCCFSNKKLTACRDKTERWLVVCVEENTAYFHRLSWISKASYVITEGHLGMETRSIWSLGNRDFFLILFKSWFICCLAVWLSIRFAASQFLQWKIISVAYFTFTVCSYSEDLIRGWGFIVHYTSQSLLCRAYSMEVIWDNT